jgi:hypothetical protein
MSPAAEPDRDASEDKKIGVKSGDPNRHSQPRLPGSVVGDASMPPSTNPRKITKVSVPKLLILVA